MRNPWMSIYLSAANKVAGTVRGQAMAAAGRQRTAASKKAAKQIASFWTGGLLGRPSLKKKPRSRR